MSLHCLCIRERITHKIATIMYSINVSIALRYFQDLVPKQTHDRRLRSSVSDSIPPQQCKTSANQAGSISSIGPKVWNSLSKDVQISNKLEDFTWKKLTPSTIT